MRCLFKVLILVCLMAGGCNGGGAATTHSLAPNERVDETNPRIMVIYGNEEFKNKLHIVRKVLDESGNLAKCSVTLQNVSQDTFIVEYQFRWLEQNGMPVMQTSAWSRATLGPNAVKPIVNMAKTPEAKNVEFTVRLPMTALYQRPVEK